MKECSKSIPRRLKDARYAQRYLVGEGVDIGGKPDPLALYREFFPGIAALRTWDIEDGDAQFLESVADESFDFVFSSHCLEHLRDPAEGLGVFYSGGLLVARRAPGDPFQSLLHRGWRHLAGVSCQ